MRGENKNRLFGSQLRNAIKESDIVQEPIKSVFSHHLNNFILAIISLLAALLVFPFSTRSITIESVALAISISASLFFCKSKKGATRLRFWVVVITMTVIAAICPFLAFPKPLYVAVVDSDNPLNASVGTLHSGTESIGSTLLLPHSDFLRQVIASILGKAFPDQFRLVMRAKQGGFCYYKLPVFKEFILDSGDKDDIPSLKSIYFPVDVQKFMFELDFDYYEPGNTHFDPNTANMSFGSLPFSGSLLDFAYNQYPETIPWEGVEIQQGEEIRTLTYAALLDRSLEYIAIGSHEAGLNALDTATAIVPAQNIEGARLAALKLEFTKLTIGGNIGCLQLLPYLHKTYDLFLESKHDIRFSQKDPLSNWLQQVLHENYEDFVWTAQFFDRLSIINNIPHVEKQQPFTKQLGSDIACKSYDELINNIKSNTYSTAELHFLRSCTFDMWKTHLLSDLPSLIRNPSLHDEFLKRMSDESESAMFFLAIIDSSLSRSGSLRTNPQLNRFFANCVNIIKDLEIGNNTDRKRMKFLQIAKRILGGGTFVDLFGTLASGPPYKIPNHSNSDWWTSDYLTWFSFMSFSAGAEIGCNAYPDEQGAFAKQFNSEHYFRQMLSKQGPGFFLRDCGGEGRIFLPSLFILTWYSQQLELEDCDNLKAEFKAKSQISFDSYFTTLPPSLLKKPDFIW